MVEYNNLIVHRMIMHTINAKLDNQDHGTAVHDHELIDLNDDVIGVIKKRLVNAAGRDSKAFELEFEHTSQGSLFSVCDNLNAKTDDQFIQASQDIADLLAECQTKSNIPGGYLLVLDCEDEDDGNEVYIFIKAEPHEALQIVEGQSRISFVNKIFLSPSQKLYKIGTVYGKLNPASDEPNDRYGCFLFDDQFRLASHPAEYFYKDFLGFSVGNNHKIQSQRFYHKTEQFIRENIADVEEKSELLRALRIEFTANQNPTISPQQFAQTYFDSPGLRGEYLDEIAHELPTAIVKDDTLLKGKLNRRKIDFPHNINIIGPEEAFDEHVQIINSEQLGEIDLNENGYTWVRIAGQPYSNE